MSVIISSGAEPADDTTYYPSSDGEPLGETSIHVRATLLLLQAMDDGLVTMPDAFVAANLYWYWEKGNAKARRAPDLMVVKGIGKQDRRSFFSWRENGAVPCTIVELSSQQTWREDLHAKRLLYQQLGVREYFLFDPEARYLRPPLQGFRRDEHGIFVPLEPDDQDRLKSEELGPYLRAEGTMLRVINAATGQPILTKTEQDQLLAEKERRIGELEAKLQAKLNGGQAP